MAVPLLDSIDIQGKVVTADALLTQRNFADYLVRERKAHYHFTVKANQSTLLEDITFFFLNRKEPDYINDGLTSLGLTVEGFRMIGQKVRQILL